MSILLLLAMLIGCKEDDVDPIAYLKQGYVRGTIETTLSNNVSLIKENFNFAYSRAFSWNSYEETSNLNSTLIKADLSEKPFSPGSFFILHLFYDKTLNKSISTDKYPYSRLMFTKKLPENKLLHIESLPMLAYEHEKIEIKNISINEGFINFNFLVIYPPDYSNTNHEIKVTGEASLPFYQEIIRN
ncbi:MAG: hypothetical protein HC819_07510 [Cyclobacteriaceae bacterium]|nr:hypothetical protein [Cyclobacteriaceae bacterium]